MRKNLYIIVVSALAVAILAGSALCQEKTSAQYAERKPLIFRLIDSLKSRYFSKNAPAPAAPAAAAKVEEKKPELPAEAKKIAEEARKLKPIKEMSREDILKHIKEMLDMHPEILERIPEIKKGPGEGEKALYLYNGVVLDDLKKDELYKLSARVTQTINAIQAERLQRQMDQIRQMQDSMRAQQSLRTIPQPYTPPSIPQPPRPPQTVPQPPPAPPQAPPTPPQPPQRR